MGPGARAAQSLGVLICILCVFEAQASDNFATRDINRPFEVDPLVDTTLLVSASAIWLLPIAFEDQFSYQDCYPCDRTEINSFDRLAVDRYSEASATASDYLAGALPLAAFGLGMMQLAEPGGAFEWLVDFVLVIESAAINGMIQRVAATAFGRPRPYMYQSDPARRQETIRDVMSFYSGHTSAAFAVATTMSYVFSKRNPKNRWRYLVWFGTMAAASTVGALRVLAGKHFPTDVIGGAAVGSAVGLLVPFFHLKKHDTGATLSAAPNRLLVTVVF